MKLILFFKFCFFAFVINILFLSCCEEFNITTAFKAQERIYLPDTNRFSYLVKDNHDLLDEFHIVPSHLLIPSKHHFNKLIDQSNQSRKCEQIYHSEIFKISYRSAINNYYYAFKMWTEPEGTIIEIEWKNRDYRTRHYFDRIVGGYIKSSFNFMDSFILNNQTYKNVIEVDYTESINTLPDDHPIKLYFASNYGIIKFISKDGIVTEIVQ